MLELELDDLPDLPASAHKTIAVSFGEFCQQPLEPCEKYSQSFAFVICSEDEEPNAINAKLVS